MQQRIITKVSVSEKISIKFDEGDRTQLSLTSEDEALDTFYDTVAAFLSTLIESAGLDSSIWQDGEVQSITLKYSDAGTAIAVSGRCNVEGKYATVSSPSRIAEDSQQALIDKLSNEAIAYLDGKRSQQSLLGIPPMSELKELQALARDTKTTMTFTSRGESATLGGAK